MRGLNRHFVSRRFHWSYPPENCALSNEEVHVWAANLDDDSQLQEFETTLSPDEKERAARFHFKRDRNHFITGRGLLRAILSCYTNTASASLQFSYGKNGKPCLADATEFGNLNFNLSHSNGLALYAVSRNRALGIDVENVRSFPEMDEIAARCFLPEEQTVLRSLESPRKKKTFFRYWTQKEAALKCMGEGFSNGESCEGFDGLIQELEPTDDCHATLAVCGKPFTLKTWQFPIAVSQDWI